MRVASVAMKSFQGQLERNMETTISLLKGLSERKVDFALFPELNLSGYINDQNQVRNLSEQLEWISELCKVSSDLQMAFAVGYPESIDENYYITHFVFDQGKLIGRHRKTHLSPSEKKTFTPGDEIITFQINNWNLGIQLCYESHFPEISYCQTQQGATLLACAFASPMEDAANQLLRFKRFLPARAYDNSCYLMAANLGMNKTNGRDFSACGVICDPKGNVVSEFEGDNSFALADLSKEMIDRIHDSKMAWFNENKRIELFKPTYER